jgi:hypothetical protein
MIMRKFALGGAASLALAAAAVVAAPGYAQNEFSKASTPAERAQTQDLNREAVEGITVRPTAAERGAYESARSQYEAAEERYKAELEDYNAKNRIYEDELRNYSNEARASEVRNNAYEGQRAQYEDEAGTIDDDTVVASGDTDDSFARLWEIDRVNDPNNELYNLPVEDIDGFLTGHFRRVELRDNGDKMVVITLNSLRTIAIPADEVRFDPDRAVIVADWTSNELDRVPSG